MTEVIVLNITTACNYKCRHCLREHPTIDNLDISILEKHFAAMKKIGVVEFSITGGEPGLHPKFHQLVETIVSHGFKINFVTNGSMLKRYEFMFDNYKSSITEVAISIDGLKTTHDFIRQPGAYDAAIESIRELVKRGIQVRTITCLNKLNIKDFEGMVSKLIDEKVSRITVSGAIETPENKFLVMTEAEQKAAKEEAERVQRKFNVPFIYCSALAGGWGVDFCGALNNLDGLAVNPKNELVFCCDTVRNGAVLGSLADHSFQELYKQAIDTAAFLKRKRADCIMDGNLPPKFNTCEFCNLCLANKIPKL